MSDVSYGAAVACTNEGLSDDQELSTKFFLGTGPADSPYTRHILPMTESMQPIRYAVAATASCHAANRLCNERLALQGLQLGLKASRLLRESLHNQAADSVSLASIMLLAQLDVSLQGSHHSAHL